MDFNIKVDKTFEAKSQDLSVTKKHVNAYWSSVDCDIDTKERGWWHMKEA